MKRKKRFKVISLLLAVIMILSSLPFAGISALAEESGDFEYEILEDGTAEIAYYTGSAETLEIPSTLDGYAVTSLGEAAFEDCASFTSITIPDSVKSIGYWAFAYCDNLTSITIPDSVTSIGEGAFYWCKSLTSITIPDSVTSIGDSAFGSCDSLTSITIPDSVTSIGSDAFYVTGYYNDDTNWENGVLYIGNHLIDANSDEHGEVPAEYSINEGTVTIADNAFSYCDILTRVTIPNSVISIGFLAFGDCESLTNVTIPESVTCIGYLAFYGCDSLTSISVDENNKNYSSQDGVLFNKEKTELIQHPIGYERTSYRIPNSVTSIDDYAFYYCESLTSITIPNSVTSIGDNAFEDCESLTSVTIPDSVTSIGDSAFSGTSYYNDDANWENGVLFIGNHLIDASNDEHGEIPSEYSIKEGTITIANDAFGGCYNLVSVTIPNSVTSIGDYTFEYCESLTSVIMPRSITSIGDWAFYYCESLTNLTIPNSVTNIGDYAFGWCSSLTSITIPNSVASIVNNAFEDSALETIYGYENSYAQTYAEENGYEFVSLGSVETGTPGDVNGDGKINALDVLIVKRYIAKYDDAKLEGDQFTLADVSGDGKVNAKDALAIMQKIAKLITSFDEIK